MTVGLRCNHLVSRNDPHSIAGSGVDERKACEFPECRKHGCLTREPETRKPSALVSSSGETHAGMNVAAEHVPVVRSRRFVREHERRFDQRTLDAANLELMR